MNKQFNFCPYCGESIATHTHKQPPNQANYTADQHSQPPKTAVLAPIDYSHVPLYQPPKAKPRKPAPKPNMKGFNQEVVKRFNAGSDGISLPEFYRWTKIRSDKKPSPAGDFVTPFLQSIFSAIVAMILVAILAPDFVEWWSFKYTAVTGVITLSVAWWSLLKKHTALYQKMDIVEELPPPAPPEPEIIERTYVVMGGNNQGENKAIKAPIAWDKMRVVLRSCNPSDTDIAKSFSQKAHSNVLTRDEFNTLRDWLILHGWCEWKNENAPNQGVIFTRSGKAAIAAIAAGDVVLQ